MLTRIHRKPLTMHEFHASFPICRVLIDYDHDYDHEHEHDTDPELGVGRWTFAAEDLMSTTSFHIIAADHTGFTVTNLERSLSFWQDVLGFELSHRAHHTGALASEVTGVPGADISIAVLKGHGHKIELLEYLARKDRKRMDVRPCDVGSVHVAFTVENLEDILNTNDA